MHMPEAIAIEARARAGHPRLRTLPGVEAVLFEPPSREALFLLRHAGWLVSPGALPGSTLGRFLRMVLVAPFTQLTFFSFDLQAFQFGVFHTTVWSRAGHLLFMSGVNFFMLLGLGQVELGGGLDAGMLYALVLALWHLSVALGVGLRAWGLCAVGAVIGLELAARACLASDAGPLQALSRHAFAGAALCAFLIAVSHAPEPRLPPRAVAGPRWLGMGEYVLGPAGARHAPRIRLANGVRVGLYVMWGTLDEWWAAMRLMPYNFLWLMFRAGYARPVQDRVLGHVRSALASGNPALDYVGIGGATMLQRQGTPR
jgi:hypothetical protein